MEKFLRENPYGKISTEIFLRENLCGNIPTGKISTEIFLRENLCGNIHTGKICTEIFLWEKFYRKISTKISTKILTEKPYGKNSSKKIPVGIFPQVFSPLILSEFPSALRASVTLQSKLHNKLYLITVSRQRATAYSATLCKVSHFEARGARTKSWRTTIFFSKRESLQIA